MSLMLCACVGLRLLSVFFPEQCLCKSTQKYAGSYAGPDLPLLFKLHDIWLVDSQENH